MSNLDNIRVTRNHWTSIEPTHDVTFQHKDNATLEEIINSFFDAAYKEGHYSKTHLLQLRRLVQASVDGERISKDCWATYTPKKGAHIHLFQAPMGGGGDGGKAVWNAILGVALIVVGVVASVYGYGIGTPLITMGAGMLVNSAAELLFPTPALSTPKSRTPIGATTAPSFDAGQTSQAYTISGATNAANPEGYIPTIFGRNKVTPPLAAKSYTSWNGGHQYFHMLVVWGQADLLVEEIKIDTTPLTSYQEVTHYMHKTTGSGLVFFGASVNEQQLNILLTHNLGWVQRTVGEGNNIVVQLYADALFRINEDNTGFSTVTVNVQAQYRNTAGGNWYDFHNKSSHSMSNKYNRPVSHTLYTGTLPFGTYEVRVRRLTSDSDSQFIVDRIQLKTVSNSVPRSPMNSIVPLTVSELRIRSSQQLNGYVDKLNGICTSICDDYTGSYWTKRPTSNPASLALYALKDPHCQIQPFEDEDIDITSFETAHDYFASEDYMFNFIADTEMSVWDRQAQILSVGRGTPTLDNDGKWGIILDNAGKQCKQLFTPKNSWDMNYNASYEDMPHALKVTFTDKNNGYTTQVGYVCWDGYTIDVAKEPNKIKATDVYPFEYKGITDWEHIYKRARHHLANLRHRRQSVTLKVDVESLISQRGDLVGVSSDTLMNNFGDGYVTALIYDIDGVEVVYNESTAPRDSNGNVTHPTNEVDEPIAPIGLRLNDKVVFSDTSARYGIARRNFEGIVTKRGEFEIKPVFDGQAHIDLYFAHTIHVAHAPEINMLCSISTLGSEYEEFLIATIQFMENSCAELTLIPYAIEEIIASETGEIPPYDPPLILDGLASYALPTPQITRIVSDESVLGTYYDSTVPTIRAYCEITEPTGKDLRNTRLQIAVYNVNSPEYVTTNYNTIYTEHVQVSPVEEKEIYAVRVRLVDTAIGATSEWSSTVTHLVIGRTTPPPPPDGLYVEGSILHIVQNNAPLDLEGHLVYVAMDDTDSINYALLVTPNYITNRMFDFSAYVGSYRTIFVRAVDELGLLSTPVFVKIGLIDKPINNVIITQSEQELLWSGTIREGEVVGTRLESNSSTQRFPQAAAEPRFNLDTEPVYAQEEGSALTYTYTVEILAEYEGAYVSVDVYLAAGAVVSISYERQLPVVLFMQDGSQTRFSAIDTPRFAQNQQLEASAFPAKYVVTQAERLVITVQFDATKYTEVEDIVTTIDVLDKELNLQDVTIEAGITTRIPLAGLGWRKITNVQGTLQYVEGNTGVNLEVLKDSVVYEGDYIKDGAYIIITDNNKISVGGIADLLVKGY